ncbi:MAG: adenine phosphoribosyltransferase [Flavobacteriales bacterium]|nr:adenine phosphoribosyltransferase [Flavobacteriales bacterium]
MIQEEVKKKVRDIPDFPKPGILFRDLTPVLAHPDLVNGIVDFFAEKFQNDKLDAVAAVEARGFWFGTLLSQRLNVPFIPIRKKGKLPYRTIERSYDLEYGQATVEMHIDAVSPGNRILIHDDLIATGGSAVAAAELIQSQGALVSGFAFLVELNDLKGREKLNPFSSNIVSLLTY